MSKIEHILGHISRKMNSVEATPTATVTADARLLVISILISGSYDYFVI